jgi:hypothetical protein
LFLSLRPQITQRSNADVETATKSNLFHLCSLPEYFKFVTKVLIIKFTKSYCLRLNTPLKECITSFIQIGVEALDLGTGFSERKTVAMNAWISPALLSPSAFQTRHHFTATCVSIEQAHLLWPFLASCLTSHDKTIWHTTLSLLVLPKMKTSSGEASAVQLKLCSLRTGCNR